MLRPSRESLLLLLAVLAGMTTFCATAVGRHVYTDHLLIDRVREADEQRLMQAAEQVKQYQQQQQQQQQAQQQQQPPPAVPLPLPK